MNRLKCSLPSKVAEILKKAMDANGWNLTESRVLDLGAGNGIMGEVLKKHGVARLIGVDIIAEAKEAVIRDRPGCSRRGGKSLSPRTRSCSSRATPISRATGVCWR